MNRSRQVKHAEADPIDLLSHAERTNRRTEARHPPHLRQRRLLRQAGGTAVRMGPTGAVERRGEIVDP